MHKTVEGWYKVITARAPVIPIYNLISTGRHPTSPSLDPRKSSRLQLWMQWRPKKKAGGHGSSFNSSELVAGTALNRKSGLCDHNHPLTEEWGKEGLGRSSGESVTQLVRSKRSYFNQNMNNCQMKKPSTSPAPHDDDPRPRNARLVFLTSFFDLIALVQSLRGSRLLAVSRNPRGRCG